MLGFGTLHLFLVLAGTWICISGSPVHLLDFPADQNSDCGAQCGISETTTGSNNTTDVKSQPVQTEHVSGQILNVDGGGVADPHGPPEGTGPVTKAENGDSLDERSRPSQAGRGAGSDDKMVRSTSGIGDAQRQSDTAFVEPVGLEGEKEGIPVSSEHILTSTSGRKHLSSTGMLPDGFVASSKAPQKLSMTGVRGSEDQGREDRTEIPGYGDSLQNEESELSLPSSTEPENPGIGFQELTSHSSIPPSLLVPPQTSTPVSLWDQEEPTSFLSDPLLPEIGPKLIPREDGPESLWTEAAGPGGEDAAVLLSQDEATEATMSSEDLPLIFEPSEDVTPEGAPAEEAAAVTLLPSNAQTPAAAPLLEVNLDQLDAVETDSDGPSNAPPLLIPDWTSPWQTSGAELLEPISSLVPSVSPQQASSEDYSEGKERGSVRTPKNLQQNLPTGSLSSLHHALTTVAISTHQPVHRSRSRLEEMESEEETDEDEDEENSEESVEDESEEDLTAIPKTSSTLPPYSLIPPPPVWVQRNQGLMRSWVELIKEKAGYVSGMLAPVGIGITGALLIVGVLYSIRMIHRKRRNSFKHQRRKQPREPGISRQDQAMLLADSSEDEF